MHAGHGRLPGEGGRVTRPLHVANLERVVTGDARLRAGDAGRLSAEEGRPRAGRLALVAAVVREGRGGQRAPPHLRRLGHHLHVRQRRLDPAAAREGGGPVAQVGRRLVVQVPRRARRSRGRQRRVRGVVRERGAPLQPRRRPQHLRRSLRRHWRVGVAVGGRRGLALAAGDGAEDGSAARQEGPTQQGGVAGVAAEAVLGGVPVLAFMGHLTLIHADGLPAGVAVLGEHGVEAVEAEGPPIPHDVPLAPQLAVALEAGEVLHVPRPSFGLRALVGEDDLVTGGAAWLEALRVVPPAVEMGVLPEVDEVDQQLLAHVAVEAGGVPAGVGSRPRRHHHDVAAAHALAAIGAGHRRVQVDRQLLDGASAQGLSLPLRREQPELLLLLVAEAVAVPHLIVMRRQLVKELFDAVFLPDGVHVRHLVLGQRREIQVDLLGLESGRHPRVLLEGAPRVVVALAVALRVRDQAAHAPEHPAHRHARLLARGLLGLLELWGRPGGRVLWGVGVVLRVLWVGRLRERRWGGHLAAAVVLARAFAVAAHFPCSQRVAEGPAERRHNHGCWYYPGGDVFIRAAY